MARTIGLFLVGLFLIPLRGLSDDCNCGDKGKGGDGFGGPVFCPLWIISEDENYKLYYCEKYNDDDVCSDPDPYYYYGLHVVPTDCQFPPGCEPVTQEINARATPTKPCTIQGEELEFKGLTSKLPAGDTYQLPQIVSNYTRVIPPGPNAIRYISFPDKQNNSRTLKLFKLEIDRRKFSGNPKFSPEKKPIWIAIECTDPGVRPEWCGPGNTAHHSVAEISRTVNAGDPHVYDVRLGGLTKVLAVLAQ